MIPRKLKRIIAARLKSYPAVAVLGPRQCGKTTLAKTFSRLYYDLESETDKVRLDLEWGDIVDGGRLVVLDEAQNYPDIFLRLKSAVDRRRSQNGRFMILGSVSPGLMRNVSEFLTGRIALCELSPFSLCELPERKDESLWLVGGFPDGGIRKQAHFPDWQQNYLALLAMRDLPHWGLPATPQLTQRFFKMLAVAHGTTWNASQIGKSMGLSYHTVNSYLDYLEQAYLVRRLPPYSSNVKKRLVKSPKVYWRDSGLLHALMGVRSRAGLLAQPGVGASWEGWVIEQVLVALQNHGNTPEAYFFRSSDGFELDLVLKFPREVWAVEIKLTSAPGKEDIDRLRRAAGLIGADRTILISRSKLEIRGGGLVCTNVRGLLAMLKHV